MTRRLGLIAPLLALALTASGCSALGLGGGSYEIGVELERAYNLFPGSPVRVLGTEIGRIADLEVSPDRDNVLVKIAVDDDVEIPDDANAVVVVASLLGERYLQIDPPILAGDTPLEPGAVIPIERTRVPAEFDEVLESLNQFVGGLDEAEFARMITNLATVLEGQGESLGRTIDQAHEAVQVLADNDEELIALVSRLSDLNETLSTRDRKLGQVIEDWNTVSGYLVDDRADIDAALSGLARITTSMAEILETHRGNLQADVETVTRLLRSSNRNLDQLSLLVLSGAELFRNSERAFDFELNWLPLVNHSGELEAQIAESIAARLVHLCSGSGFPDALCSTIPDVLAGEGELCFEPVVPCSTADQASVGDALRAVVDEIPEMYDVLVNRPDRVADPLGPYVRDALRGTDREVQP